MTFASYRELCGQLDNCSVKLADILTTCSSHPQGKSETRCEIDGGFIGVVPVHACPCGLVRKSKCQCDWHLCGQPHPLASWWLWSSSQVIHSLHQLLAGVIWMSKASFTLSWIALSSTLVLSRFTWCCWCSAMADFHVSPLLHASLFFNLHACSLTFCRKQILIRLWGYKLHSRRISRWIIPVTRLSPQLHWRHVKSSRTTWARWSASRSSQSSAQRGVTDG